MLSEPLALVLNTIERGQRGMPLAALYAALPGPAHISAIYVDELAMMGLIVVKEGRVWSARVPASTGGARPG